jgi:hypothetical protein
VGDCVNRCALHLVVTKSQLETKETPSWFLHGFVLQDLLALDIGNEVTTVVSSVMITKTIDFTCGRYQT